MPFLKHLDDKTVASAQESQFIHIFPADKAVAQYFLILFFLLVGLILFSYDRSS
jgi:hypothetical protein